MLARALPIFRDVFPPDPFDTTFDHVLLTTLVVLFWGYVVLLLVRFLRRSRPGLDVGFPLAFGYALRIISIAAVTATGIGTSLRGGDEIGFVAVADRIASTTFTSHFWLPWGPWRLYEQVFALQVKLGLTVADMRITDAALATIGVVFVVVAVHDLAGARPARLTAWLLALEPVSIFFAEVLHKEPLETLASGLVVFGCTKVWKRLSGAGVAAVVLGSAIAVLTRSYAGWFLVAGATFVMTHAAVRSLRESGRSMAMLLGVAGVLAFGIPIVLQKTTPQALHHLQVSQTANTQGLGNTQNNLALEQVNFSTRAAIVTNLPKRIVDLLIKPFPWQLGDASQQIGALGTLIAYAVFVMLFLYVLRLRGQVLRTTAPILYPLIMLTLAYALSVGNAGTGFRYRSHIVVLSIAAVVVLRSRWIAVAAAARLRGRIFGWRASSGDLPAGAHA